MTTQDLSPKIARYKAYGHTVEPLELYAVNEKNMRTLIRFRDTKIMTALAVLPLFKLHQSNLDMPVNGFEDLIPVLLSSDNIIEFLIELGFDVFGLIPIGVAIEKTT